MGYVTYSPDKLADTPVVDIDGELTITRTLDMDEDMREYWQVGDETWYWIDPHSAQQRGIPVPAMVLNALRDLGNVYRQYRNITFDEVNFKHRDITYKVIFEPFFYIYASYCDADGVFDKRPFINDTVIGAETVFAAISEVEF